MNQQPKPSLDDVMERISGYGSEVPRFHHSGIPTFFRAELTADPAAVDIGLVGLPTDAAVTQRPGTRYGPRAMRDASGMLNYQNASTGM